MVHYTAASDDSYLQPAIFLLDPTGPLTSTAYISFYSPLGDNGIQQLLIDPWEIQYNIFDRFTLGLSLYYWQPETGDPLTKIGPKLGLLDELGITELRVARNIQAENYEIQIRRFLTF